MSSFGKRHSERKAKKRSNDNRKSNDRRISDVSNEQSVPEEILKQWWVRRLCYLSFVLIFVPFALNWIFLSPEQFTQYTTPLAASFRMVLSQIKPYLVAAFAFSIFGIMVSYGKKPLGRCLPKASFLWGICAGAVIFIAAAYQPTIQEALIARDTTVRQGISEQRDWLEIGGGGFLGPSFPIEYIPLEEAGNYVQQDIPGTPAPQNVKVQWYAKRLSEEIFKGRIYLVAGGMQRDITSEFASLKAGEGAFFSHAVRVGPSAATVRLHIGQKAIAPQVFLDVTRNRYPKGMTIEAGGGDYAFQTDITMASSKRNVNPPFIVEGRHTPSGYTVIVISGEDWSHRNLSDIAASQGEIEIQLASPASDIAMEPLSPPWSLSLIAEGKQTNAVPLETFSIDEKNLIYRYPLDSFDWRTISPSHVLGVAFKYNGTPGDFWLALNHVRAVQPLQWKSGFGVGTTTAFDPKRLPQEAFFAVGTEPVKYPIADHIIFLQFIAAFLIMIALMGLKPAWNIIKSRPGSFISALLMSISLAFILHVGLPTILEIHIEHIPMILALSSIVIAAVVHQPIHTKPLNIQRKQIIEQHNKSLTFTWVNALKVVAAFGIITIHVTSDSAGLPFASFPPDQRIPPMIVRAFAMGLNYHIFLLASFFLLAHSCTHKNRLYLETITHRAKRLLPPFLAWTVFFIFFRYGKAIAFGYSAALRRELASGTSWAGYFLLGKAQYHLHFIPLLMALTLFYPLYRPALKKPWLGFSVVITFLLHPVMDKIVYTHIMIPTTRAYALMFTKIIAFLGYGLFAFAMYGLYTRGFSNGKRKELFALAVITFIPTFFTMLWYTIQTAQTGRWVQPDLAAHMAIGMLPITVFLFFMLADRIQFPSYLLSLTSLSFGIYLIHPLCLDIMEIISKGLSMPPFVTTLVNFMAVSAGAILLAHLLNRIPQLSWIIGGRS